MLLDCIFKDVLEAKREKLRQIPPTSTPNGLRNAVLATLQPAGLALKS